MKPTIGRIAWWTTPVTNETFPAIITGVYDETVALTVFYPDKPPSQEVAPFKPVPWAGHWCWPVRDEVPS